MAEAAACWNASTKSCIQLGRKTHLLPTIPHFSKLVDSYNQSLPLPDVMHAASLLLIVLTSREHINKKHVRHKKKCHFAFNPWWPSAVPDCLCVCAICLIENPLWRGLLSSIAADTDSSINNNLTEFSCAHGAPCWMSLIWLVSQWMLRQKWWSLFICSSSASLTFSTTDTLQHVERYSSLSFIDLGTWNAEILMAPSTVDL